MPLMPLEMKETRNRFLKPNSRRAIYELKESWNIIVTVRTYDANKIARTFRSIR